MLTPLSRIFRSSSLTWVLALHALPSWGQLLWKDDFDTMYVRDYTDRVTGRLYLSTKYNSLTLIGPMDDRLVHRPNNRVNIGIGASYRGLTLNIGFGVPFLNQDDEVRGKTRYLDAQANFHTQRWAANLFLQVFSGYYIATHSKEQLGWIQPTERPYREDLTEFNIGVSMLRVLNDRRFSYRAAFSQDAWQRRSQGSWLVGGYSTYFNADADSSLVPTALQDQYDDVARMRLGRFADIGPMGGYVYTFVWKEHWFLTLSAAAGAGPSIQRITHEVGDGVAEVRNAGLGWHLQMRAATGYNSRRRYVGMSFNQENIGYLLPDQQVFRWAVGNLRFNFVHRFNRRVREVDRGLRWFRKKVVEPVTP